MTTIPLALLEALLRVANMADTCHYHERRLLECLQDLYTIEPAWRSQV